MKYSIYIFLYHNNFVSNDYNLDECVVDYSIKMSIAHILYATFDMLIIAHKIIKKAIEIGLR